MDLDLSLAIVSFETYAPDSPTITFVLLATLTARSPHQFRTWKGHHYYIIPCWPLIFVVDFADSVFAYMHLLQHNMDANINVTTAQHNSRMGFIL